MSLFKHGKLAMCISVVTMLGACGADAGDEPLDADHDHESASGSGSSADAGRSSGNASSGNASSGASDAGTAVPVDATSAGALPSLYAATARHGYPDYAIDLTSLTGPMPPYAPGRYAKSPSPSLTCSGSTKVHGPLR